jgi:glycogen operon protein
LLGAYWDGSTTSFRVASRHATALELELDMPGGVRRIPLARVDDLTWHAQAPAPPGTRYGYRVAGPWSPAEGHLFNPHKLLLDPWALMVDGPVRWHPSLSVARRVDGQLEPSDIDSGPVMPRSVVLERAAPIAAPRPNVPWRDTIIYECHVKGMTALHPEVPPALRGTYLGLASDPVIRHLSALGVTAVELLPVHPGSDNAHVVQRGLANYWGYASLAFFAPDRRFASVPGEEVTEFREMVARLHAAGIEVLLDVVYNHSGEGGVDGCTAVFRGLDNATWYRHRPGGGYEDFTGCGNTLDFREPVVRQLVRDSLAYWARDMGVDGFRFDLAPTLGRNADAPDSGTMPWLEELRDDPALKGRKLIAEPWDLGPGGYRQGRFPPGWSEWNGRYRDAVRRFWRGHGTIAELATRVSGSSDLFAPSERTPQGSVNFVACHDGFTLADLVSYERKHNVGNGEGNRDGADWSESQNFGREGPSADGTVEALRERTMRNLLATLMFSLGVPMLSQGDEHARTQSGNNNPWCQDNALAWMPWNNDARARRVEAFTRELVALRRRYGVFRRTAFLHVQDMHDARALWLTRDAKEMTVADWEDPTARLLVVALQTGIADDASRHGWVLLVVNGSPEPDHVRLPEGLADRWHLVLTTGEEPAANDGGLEVPARSVVLFEGL